MNTNRVLCSDSNMQLFLNMQFASQAFPGGRYCSCNFQCKDHQVAVSLQVNGVTLYVAYAREKGEPGRSYQATYGYGRAHPAYAPAAVMPHAALYPPYMAMGSHVAGAPVALGSGYAGQPLEATAGAGARNGYGNYGGYAGYGALAYDGYPAAAYGDPHGGYAMGMYGGVDFGASYRGAYGGMGYGGSYGGGFVPYPHVGMPPHSGFYMPHAGPNQAYGGRSGGRPRGGSVRIGSGARSTADGGRNGYGRDGGRFGGWSGGPDGSRDGGWDSPERGRDSGRGGSTYGQGRGPMRGRAAERAAVLLAPTANGVAGGRGPPKSRAAPDGAAEGATVAPPAATADAAAVVNSPTMHAPAAAKSGAPRSTAQKAESDFDGERAHSMHAAAGAPGSGALQADGGVAGATASRTNTADAAAASAAGCAGPVADRGAAGEHASGADAAGEAGTLPAKAKLAVPSSLQPSLGQSAASGQHAPQMQACSGWADTPPSAGQRCAGSTGAAEAG